MTTTTTAETPAHESPAISAAPPAAGDRDARALLDFLRERDVACPLCEYNLRGLLSPRCPECGRDLELRIGLSEPRQGAWLTAQLALAATGGIGLLAIITVIASGWPQTGQPFQWLFDLCFSYYFASIPLALALLVWRRRYLRLGRTLQWAVAAVAVLLAVVTIVALPIATS